MKKTIFVMLSLITIGTQAQENQNQKPSDSLKTKTEKLEEVTIFGNRKQYLKVESDKTTVAIKDNAMLNTGTSLQAIKRLPGIITSPTGSISLNGKGVRIYIDGSPSTLSGNDLQNYLASLPAAAIEKVELIYNPGASFDANSSGSVINIVTSQKRLKGINANFNINYNFNRYQKPSPQLMLNGKEKNFSWQTMFGFNYIDSENRTKNGQTFTTFNPVKTLDQENFTQTTDRNQYFRVGTNYKLTSKSNLLFNYNANFSNDRAVYTVSTFGEGINYIDNVTTKTKSNNHEISLQFKTKLDTLGRTLDVVGFTNFFNKTPKTNSITSTNSTNSGDIEFKLKNSYLKFDFEIPFKEYNFSLNAGSKYNTISVINNGDYSINATPSRIEFDYTENNLAFYTEARKKIKKWSFTAGLRFENFEVTRKANTLTDEIKFTNNNFFLFCLIQDFNCSK